MTRQSGFSLIELAVILAIIAIASAIAIPNMIGWRNRANLGDGARSIYSAFQLARTRAARDNSDITISFAPSGSLGRNFILFVDDGAGTPDTSPADGIPDGAGNGVPDGTETIVANNWLPQGVAINSTTFGADNATSFSGNGLPSENGTVVISNSGGDIYSVILSVAGRVRIDY